MKWEPKARKLYFEAKESEKRFYQDADILIDAYLSGNLDNMNEAMRLQMMAKQYAEFASTIYRAPQSWENIYEGADELSEAEIASMSDADKRGPVARDGQSMWDAILNGPMSEQDYLFADHISYQDDNRPGLF